MKILIVGGAGFVGTHMQKFLADKKEFTFQIYDQVNGDDTRDRFKLDRMFESEGFDAIINLAARAGVRRGEGFPEEYFSTNVIGLANLIEMAEKWGVKKLVHYSSSSVFGNDEKVATNEGYPKKPKSIYGITKLAGELLLQKSKLDYTIIRPFTIVGEDGRKEMVVYKWLNQIKAGRKATFYGDGTTYRGYTYIQDMLRGTIECLTNPKASRQDFNLGGDQIITLEDLWNIFKEAYPQAEREIVPMPETDQMFSLADVSKAKELLGWEHKTDIKKKIQEMIVL